MGSKQTSCRNSKDMEVQAERIKALDKMTYCTSPGPYPSISAAHREKTARNRPTFLPLNPLFLESTNTSEMLVNVLAVFYEGFVRENRLK